jgi:hypothetical protein
MHIPATPVVHKVWQFEKVLEGNVDAMCIHEGAQDVEILGERQ